jgi:uncharacterized protein (TIGR02646 family)
MHLLKRLACPDCLHRYQHGRDNWDTFKAQIEHVVQVRSALDGMQQGQCAYCEAPLNGGWHIEHLWPRSSFPTRTFDWANLFACCMRRDCCGTHKDQGGRPYDPADLIDPAHEDPDDFLFFAQDGTVQPRAGLAGRGLFRAKETIRVFNLNAPVLRQQRAQVVRTLLTSEPDVVEVLAQCVPDERWAWVQDLLGDYRSGGFMTPIRHLLCIGAQ